MSPAMITVGRETKPHTLHGAPLETPIAHDQKPLLCSRKKNEGCLWCSECRKEFGMELLLRCPACRGPLEFLTPLPVANHWHKTKNLRHMAFSAFFPMPVSTHSRCITLEEGGTPLILCDRLKRSLKGPAGPQRLYLKNEAMNPTASWKDRSTSLAVNCAVRFGSKVVTIYSCGNAGSAAAAYAARAGLCCVVLATPSISPTMVNSIHANGGIVAILNITSREIWIEGRVAELLSKAQSELGWFPLTTVSNPPCGSPYYTEGYKSIAYEIALELNETPDWVIVPVGSGEGLRGVWKGFQEAHRFGWISELPKMVGVQASGAAPLVAAFEKGASQITPIEKASTVASGIEVMMSSNRALQVVYNSGGCALSLSDREIREASCLISTQEGLHMGPEGAATIAGALKLRELDLIRCDDSVVCISTASGLKYPKFRTARGHTDSTVLQPNLKEIGSYVQRELRR